MKKWILPIVVIVLLAFWGFGINNTAVDLNEDVKEAWGNVQNSYQRRNDLIGNLVNTVKGAADFEKSTLEAVVKARSEATKPEININNADDLSPEKLQQLNKAQSGLSSALSRLLLVVEKYPDLKANQNFLELQAQLEGTENRIAVSRQKFNASVQDYNSYIRSFPRVIYAGWFDFEKKGYFEAEAGTEQAPTVEF